MASKSCHAHKGQDTLRLLGFVITMDTGLRRYDELIFTATNKSLVKQSIKNRQRLLGDGCSLPSDKRKLL